MGQARGTDHQGHGIGEHVQGAEAHVRRILLEAQVHHDAVDQVQQVDLGTGHLTAQSQLRQRVAGQLQADKNCRDGVGQNQHAVLGDLGIGNALHATEYRVEEHDHHADEQAGSVFHLQEAGESHANALHLADNIGHRTQDQADNRHYPCGLRIEAIADELRHRELAVLA